MMEYLVIITYSVSMWLFIISISNLGKAMEYETGALFAVKSVWQILGAIYFAVLAMGIQS